MLKQVMHKLTTFFVKLLTDETTVGNCARVWACVLNLCLGAELLICSQYFKTNTHATFWLEVTPMVTLLVTMLSLGFSFLIVVRIRSVQYYRHIRNKSVDQKTRAYCEPSAGVIRLSVLLMAVLSITAIFMGAGVMIAGEAKRQELEVCTRQNTASANVETTHASLVKFRGECQQIAGQANTKVDMCPDFKTKFPASKVINYLMKIGVEEQCSGFCEASSQASLFQSSRKILGSSNGACAAAAAKEVARVSFFVGVPSVMVGCLELVGAWLLYNFEHL